MSRMVEHPSEPNLVTILEAVRDLAIQERALSSKDLEARVNTLAGGCRNPPPKPAYNFSRGDELQPWSL